MLVQTPFKKGDTVSMKLITGEELMTRIDKIEDDAYVCHKPLSLLQSPQGMVLGQFMITMDQDSDITLPKSSILCVATPEKTMASKYTEATTGIVT